MTKEEFKQKFMAQLNEQQQKAVQTVDGAVLLLAVPGSGKTTVLVTRLGYMVCCCGIDASSILIMTYTVAATKEMNRRFASMFGEQYANAMEFRTINGISSKIIDFYSRNYGKRKAFDLIENDGEATRIVGQIYQQLNKEYPTESIIKDIRTGITYIKNMMLTVEEIEKLDVGVENMPEIYRQYCNLLKCKELMDYDDQMSYALTILKSYPTVLDYFQDKFRYICVDESQDTSKIQHTIIKLLAQKYGNIFMVGDEDQSIYGFRAAYPEALMNFENDYPNAKVLLMEQNYRSTEEIVSVANAFVTKNRFRYEKTIQATRGAGLQIQKINVDDCIAQYKYIFTVAKDCTEETAVLYRNNDSALPLIDMFERNGISYNCKKVDVAFFSHKIINDITDIINFAYNQNDEPLFMRIYYKFGSPISKKAATYACEQSRRSGKTILEELIGFSDMKNYAKDAAIDLLVMFPEILKDNAEVAINRIWNDMRYQYYVEDNKLDVGKFPILCMLGKNESSAMDLLRRLDELKDIIQNHQNRSETKFFLSTIHSSKGLEYDRVFLLDIFDGTLPSNTVPQATIPDEVRLYEEERRLYYVAITRAKNELYLFDCTDNLSSFNAEIFETLPMEIVDSNDVFASLKQNLCGRTYTDREGNKGVIIAQRRDSVLIEYENKKLQILTVAKMFENRNTTVKHIVPVVGKVASKELISQSIVQHSSVGIASMAMIAKIGGKVYHRSFGNGIITNITGDIISICFDGMVEPKKFVLSLLIKNNFFKFTI